VSELPICEKVADPLRQCQCEGPKNDAMWPKGV
jgi:hypothetical protein